MSFVDTNIIIKQLNKCYLDYDPTWQTKFDEHRVLSFKSYIEQHGGLRLVFIRSIKNGKYGYELQQVAIVDEPKFTMWMLRWS
jgi:hypothetical protein